LADEAIRLVQESIVGNRHLGKETLDCFFNRPSIRHRLKRPDPGGLGIQNVAYPDKNTSPHGGSVLPSTETTGPGPSRPTGGPGKRRPGAAPDRRSVEAASRRGAHGPQEGIGRNGAVFPRLAVHGPSWQWAAGQGPKPDPSAARPRTRRTTPAGGGALPQAPQLTEGTRIPSAGAGGPRRAFLPQPRPQPQGDGGSRPRPCGPRPAALTGGGPRALPDGRDGLKGFSFANPVPYERALR
jgi:hypothetical protein